MENNADADAADDSGMTPLMFAVIGDHRNVVEVCTRLTVSQSYSQVFLDEDYETDVNAQDAKGRLHIDSF